MMENIRRMIAPQQNRCHLCRAALYGEGRVLCPDCISALDGCRLPESDRLAFHKPLMTCLSAFAYMAEAEQLVWKLKFSHDTAAAAPLSAAMTDVLVRGEWFGFFDMLVPVPLHEQRYAERGFNQSAYLARPVAQAFGLEVREDALKRVRYTDTQIGRTAEQRRAAFSDAFEADPNIVAGRRVLLVDDVLTTGSTAVACANELIGKGARGVWLITACRA